MMQRMLHTNAAIKAEEAMEQVEVRRQISEGKKEQAASVRQWYQASKHELADEKKLELEEQREQARQ